MPSRMRRPEELRIPLPTDDDWIVVKKHLTYGEYRHSQARMMRELVPGAPLKLDPEEVGVSLVLVYLLEWSLQDPEGRTIPIRGMPEESLRATLLELDPEKGQEVAAAIATHHKAMEDAREAEKKTTPGAVPPSPISGSAG